MRHVPSTRPGNDRADGELASFAADLVGEFGVERSVVADFVPFLATRDPPRLRSELKTDEGRAIPTPPQRVECMDVVAVDAPELGVILRRVRNVLQGQEWFAREKEGVRALGVVMDDGVEQGRRTFVELLARRLGEIAV